MLSPISAFRLTCTRHALAALSTVTSRPSLTTPSLPSGVNVPRAGLRCLSQLPSVTSLQHLQAGGRSGSLCGGSDLVNLAAKWNECRLFASKAGKKSRRGSDSDAILNEIEKDASGPEGNASISGSSQHDTWVGFQRSIAVAGFETGQIVKEKHLTRKSRGGKMNRKRMEKEAELAAALRGEDSTSLKGGEFPALRYSDEETERLLAQAYAAIPPRAGKRGTNNLRRQKRRWWIKRQYDAKKKYERIKTHDKRMSERHEISVAMHQIREEAREVREKEKDYQQKVLDHWATLMGYSNSGESGNVSGDRKGIDA